MVNRNLGDIVRVALIALAGVAIWFLSNYESQPHKQNYAAKAATDFSALRADAALGRILGPEIPDPVSSDAAAAVRGRIQAEFSALGVPTHTYTAFTCNAWRGFGFVACATVTDVIAEAVPGKGKAIVLLAHYDSVPAGPGASDDKSGVATVLETVRALKARGGSSLHPVIAVITDGEEAGLLGANAFLQNAGLKDRVGVVVNVEARGTRGASLLFQTSPGDGRLVDLYAHSAPVMATSSLYAEIYKFLPNDTDLTLFIRAGFPSYNFAFADNVKYYHSPFDLRRNLSRATLQMHGDNMLSVASALERTDYAALKGGNDVYLSVLGTLLPRMPETLALPFALLVFLGIAAATWRARGTPLSWRATFGAGFMPLALILGCTLTGFIAAAIAKAMSGHPDPSYAFPMAMRLGLGFGVFAMTLLVSRMTAMRGAVSAAWLWMAGLGVVTAIFLPGISPYFTFPSFIAAILLLATARGGWGSAAGRIAVGVSALGALIIWIALVCSGETLMGLSLHELFTIPAAFGLMTVVPLLAERPMGRAAWSAVTASLAVVALGCAVAQGLEQPYSAQTPQRINILYFQDSAAHARWIADTSWKGIGAEPIPASLIQAGALKLDANAYPGLNLGAAYVGDAGAPRYTLPTASVVSDTKQGGNRVVVLALNGSAATNAMMLRIPKEAKLIAIDFRGQHMVTPPGWHDATRLLCVTRDCRDMRVTLTLGNSGPLNFAFAEQRYGLPAFGSALKAARPDTAMPSQSGDGVILASALKLR